MTASRHSLTSVQAALAGLPHWQFDAAHHALRRQYEFGDFSEAFAFMTRVALLAERMDHHPDWRNVYRRVEVTLSTHDAGGVTERDLDMARAMDALVFMPPR